MQQAADTGPSGRRRPGFVEAGLAVGGALALVELVSLGSAAPGLIWVVITLLGALGLGVGLLLEAQEALVARFRLHGWSAAAARAGGSLLVTVPVASTLMDGAFASTLPGAATAHVWLPIAALAGLTLLLRGLDPRDASSRRIAFTGYGLAALGVGVELCNRHVKASELADAHTALIVVTLVALVLSSRCLVELPRPASRRTTWITRGVVGLVLLSTISCLRWGLGDPDDRWTLATHGTHGRLIVRAVRLTMDADGDGYAAVLGGSDCDDDDADRNPDAPELPGNEIDENCDGFVAPIDPSLDAHQAAMRSSLDDWAETPPVREFLDRTRDLDVILVTVDALRADMLTPTERNRREFPNLIGLVDASVRFDRAFSSAAGTDLSMSTILSGRIDPFSAVETTIAEAMADSGRKTHGIVPSEVLRYAGKTLLTRGLVDFDRLVNDRFERDVGSYSTSQRATELALRATETLAEDESQYLWIHFFDVHEHGEIDTRRRRIREIIGNDTISTREERYRATVKLVDAALGELIAGLERHDRYRRTILVLASDHGESLGEDPRLPENHGLFVYNPLVHVPLLFRIPGVEPHAVPVAVSLLDLAPTMAHLVGADLGPADGTSLLPQLLHEAPADLRETSRPVILNESEQHGIIVWPFKLMQRPADNLVELYDLSLDFEEQDNLAASQPARVQQLLSAYHAYPHVELDRTRKGRRQREQAARSPATDEP